MRSRPTALTAKAMLSFARRSEGLNPRVVLRLQASNDYADMIGDGIDLAIRGHARLLPDSRLIRLLPDWTAGLPEISLLMHERRGSPHRSTSSPPFCAANCRMS